MLSAAVPWVITPLLMLGGAFLCYEGFEKVAHRLLHSKREDRDEHAERLAAIVDRGADRGWKPLPRGLLRPLLGRMV